MPVRWDVDARPASPWTRLYVRGMELARDQDAFRGAAHTREVALRLQRKGDRAPTWLTRATARTATDTVAGMTVWTVRPRRAQPVARVLYLHGGGYVHPLTVDYWRLVRALVRVPAEVVVPAYPLAPGNTVDDVLPRLVEVEAACRTREPLRTVVMGDSAGGALSLVVAARLRDLDRPRPAGVVMLSPWLDATLDQREVAELEPSDPMLAESGLRAAGEWWSGSRAPDDPLVSPLHADLSGLPPLDLLIGDRDILRPAVDLFAERGDEAGAHLHVHEVPAMFHVWMTRAIPEARRTRRLLVDLVRRRS